jgi:hypothetical protein
VNVVLIETVPLPLGDSASEPPRQGPTLCAEPLEHEVRLRRQQPPSPSGRTWWLDVVVLVSLPDPEQVLQESEYFLVDSTDSRPIGLVEAVETDVETGFVSALRVVEVSPGRRRLYVDAKAIELLIPATERIVVRVPPEGFPTLDEPSS